jgi:hypothetical protein
MSSTNASTTKFRVNGSGFFVFIPDTLDTDGKISAFGTAVKCEALKGTGVTFPEIRKQEYSSTVLDTGATVELPKNMKIIDGVTGAEKSAPGDTGYGSIDVETLETDADSISAIASLAGKPGIACIGGGQDALGAMQELYFLHCKPSGKIELPSKPNEPKSFKSVFNGYPGVAATGVDESDLTSAFGTGASVKPMGADDISKLVDTGNAFTSGELAALLAGEVVVKDAL